MKLLFLDDLRDPHMASTYTNNTIYVDHKWDVVRNFDEFTSYIKTNGLPDVVSFDHDLADEHYVPSEYWSDYDLSKEYQDSQSYREKTGDDCAKWMVDYCKLYNLDLPEWYIHSMNPVGADYIKKTLVDYES